MNRIVKTVAALTVTLGLAFVGLPLSTGGATTMSGVGSTGCCKI
ncbi:hypothetical protein [Actinotalea solisilvae]|nr:hypothetical protein [Actinotalea solisilvae]